MPTGTRPTPATRQTKLVFSGTYQDAVWNNVMWLFLTGSGEITIPELNDLAAACSAAYSDNFLVWLNENLSLDRTQVVLYSAGDAFEGLAAEGGTGGHSTGVANPANVAACLSWQIAPVYRGGHPRTYLCGLSSDQQDGVTTFAGGLVSALSSAAEAFHSDIEAISGISDGIATVEHGIVSFVRSKAWRTPPVFYRIVGATVDARIDTQRRRLGPDIA